METVNITTVTNNLPSLKIELCPPVGPPVIIDPPSTLGFRTTTIPLIETEDEINSDNIFAFRVEGFEQEFAFAAIKNRGIVSALGRTGPDFFPDDPLFVRETHPDVKAGDSIICKFEIRYLVGDEGQGSLAIWVLGALDELPQKVFF